MASPVIFHTLLVHHGGEASAAWARVSPATSLLGARAPRYSTTVPPHLRALIQSIHSAGEINEAWKGK